MNTILTLYISFFQVGLFSIGGGLAALPLIQHQVVDIHGWLNIGEFTDLVTIAEMTPGPIAINASTFVGTRLSELPGALIATLGAISPSIIIVGVLTFIYVKYKNLDVIQGALAGLRPAVIALIASAAVTIVGLALWGSKENLFKMDQIRPVSLILMALAIIGLRKAKLHPIAVIFLCGVATLLLSYIPVHV